MKLNSKRALTWLLTLVMLMSSVNTLAEPVGGSGSAPVESPAPVVESAGNSAATNVPAVGTDSEATETPAPTDVPDAGTDSGATETPAPTAVPDAGADNGATETPAPTDVPEVGADNGATEVPAPTDVPDAGADNGPTETPAPTAVPDAGTDNGATETPVPQDQQNGSDDTLTSVPDGRTLEIIFVYWLEDIYDNNRNWEPEHLVLRTPDDLSGNAPPPPASELPEGHIFLGPFGFKDSITIDPGKPYVSGQNRSYYGFDEEYHYSYSCTYAYISRPLLSCKVQGISKETGSVLYEAPIELPKDWAKTIKADNYEDAEAVKGYTRAANSQTVSASENGQIITFEYYTDVYVKAPDKNVPYQLQETAVTETAQAYRVHDGALVSGLSFPGIDLSCTAQIPAGTAVGTVIPLAIVSDGIQGTVDESGKFKIVEGRNGAVTVAPIDDLIVDVSIEPQHTVYNNVPQSPAAPAVIFTPQNHPDEFNASKDQFGLTEAALAKLAAIAQTNAGIYSLGLTAEDFACTSPLFTNVTFNVPEDGGQFIVDKRQLTVTLAKQNWQYEKRAQLQDGQLISLTNTTPPVWAILSSANGEGSPLCDGHTLTFKVKTKSLPMVGLNVGCLIFDDSADNSFQIKYSDAIKNYDIPSVPDPGDVEIWATEEQRIEMILDTGNPDTTYRLNDPFTYTVKLTSNAADPVTLSLDFFTQANAQTDPSGSKTTQTVTLLPNETTTLTVTDKITMADLFYNQPDDQGQLPGARRTIVMKEDGHEDRAVTFSLKTEMGVSKINLNVIHDSSKALAAGDNVTYLVDVSTFGNMGYTYKNIKVTLDNAEIAEGEGYEVGTSADGKPCALLPDMKDSDSATVSRVMGSSGVITASDILHGRKTINATLQADYVDLLGKTKSVEKTISLCLPCEPAKFDLSATLELNPNENYDHRNVNVLENCDFILKLKNNGNVPLDGLTAKASYPGTYFAPGSAVNDTGTLSIHLLNPGEFYENHLYVHVEEKDILNFREPAVYAVVDNEATINGSVPYWKLKTGGDPHNDSDYEKAVWPSKEIKTEKPKIKLAPPTSKIVLKFESAEPEKPEGYIAGDVIKYKIRCKNEGNLSVKNIKVTSSTPGVVFTNVYIDDSTLAPQIGENGQNGKAVGTAFERKAPLGPNKIVCFQAEYTVNAEDILNGYIRPSFTGKAEKCHETQPKVNNFGVENWYDMQKIPAPLDKSFVFSKVLWDPIQNCELTNPVPFRLGDTVTFRTTFKNTGNITYSTVALKEFGQPVSITAVTGIDQLLIDGANITIKDLAPQQEMVMDICYTVSQADILSGVFDASQNVYSGNECTSKTTLTSIISYDTDLAVPPADCTFAAPVADSKLSLTPSYRISLQKKDTADIVPVTQETRPDKGDTLFFEYHLKNTGDIAFSGITLTFAVPNGNAWSDFSVLPESAAPTCTGHQVDFASYVLKAGEELQIRYAYTVTRADVAGRQLFPANAQLMAIDALSIEGKSLPAEFAKPASSLPYELTAAEINPNPLVSSTVKVVRNGEVLPEGSKLHANDTVQYIIVVENQSNAELPYLEASLDNDNDISLTLESCTSPGYIAGDTAFLDGLGFGESVTVTVSYNVTEDDIKAAFQGAMYLEKSVRVNASCASPIAPEYTVSFSENKELYKPEFKKPAGDWEISIKPAANQPSENSNPPVIGNLIEYDVTVTNKDSLSMMADIASLSDSGNGEISVLPPKAGEPSYVLDGNRAVTSSIAPGKSFTVHYRYTVTEEDFFKGGFEVYATAQLSAEDPYYDQIPAKSIRSQTLRIETAPLAPALGANKHEIKHDTNERPNFGENISFIIELENIGNIPLYDLHISEFVGGTMKPSSAGAYTVSENGKEAVIEKMPVGSSINIEVSYTVTREDVRNGKIESTLQASFLNPYLDNFPMIPSISKDVYVSILTASPSVWLENNVLIDRTGLPNDHLFDLNDAVRFEGNIKLADSSNALPDKIVLTARNGFTFDETSDGVRSENNTVLTISNPASIDTVYHFYISKTVDCHDIARSSVTASVIADAFIGENSVYGDNTTPFAEYLETRKTVPAKVDLSLTMTDSIPEGKATAAVGEKITYTIVARNDGNLLYKNLRIANDLPGLAIEAIVPSDSEVAYAQNADGSVTAAQMKPGQFITITASYTVTEQDILEKGWISCVAAAKADNIEAEPSETAGYVVEASASVRTEVDNIDPKVGIVLSCDQDKPAAGTLLTITAEMLHEGNISESYLNFPVAFTTENVKLSASSDDSFLIPSPADKPYLGLVKALAKGTPVLADGTYTVTEQDIINGEINFAFAVTDADPANGEITAFPNPKVPGEMIMPYGSTALSVPTQKLKHTLDVRVDRCNMASDGSPRFGIGEIIQYDIHLVNMGNVTYKNVTFDLPDGFQLCDNNFNPIEDRTATIPEILPNDFSQNCSFKVIHQVTKEDFIHGQVEFYIDAKADPLVNSITGEKIPVFQRSGNTVYVKPIVPKLTVLNAADAPIEKALGVGDKLNFTITVKNEGNIDVTDIAVTSTLHGYKFLPADGITIENGIVKKDILLQNEEFTIKAEYTVQESDIINGSISNAVMAEGAIPHLSDIYPHYPRPVNPSAKDIWFTPSVAALKSDLAVNITSDKEGEKADFGDVIHYTITVENAGNVTYTNVRAQLEAGIAEEGRQKGTLLPSDDGSYTITPDGKAFIQKMRPGEKMILSGQYTVTEDDIGRGSIKAAVSAQADELLGAFISPSGSNEVTVACAAPAPQFALYMATPEQDASHQYALGETVRFRITFKNQGNMTLSHIKLAELPGIQFENDFSSNIANFGSLAPKRSVQIYASHRITADDIANGKFVNTVTAHCVYAAENTALPSKTVTMAVPTEKVKTDLSVGVQVSKPDSLLAAGDTINYIITVANNGNVNYTNVAVQDVGCALTFKAINPSGAAQQFKDRVVIPALAVGQQVQITASYTVTIQDLLKGAVRNMLTAKGDPIPDPHAPGTSLPVEGSASATLETEDVNAALSLTVSSDVAAGKTVKPGDTIHYTITVKNTGNTHQAYTNIILKEHLSNIWTTAGEGYKVPAKGTVAIDRLPYGKPITIRASYKVTDQDILNGSIVNQITASGDGLVNPKAPGGPAIIPQSSASNTVLTEPLSAGMTVQKTSSVSPETFLLLGKQIRYAVTVTNNGNVSFHNVVITDHLAGAVPVQSKGCKLSDNGTVLIKELKAGQTVSAAFLYTVQEKDVAAGTIVNRVTVKADTLNGHDQAVTPSGQSSVTNAVQTEYSYRIQYYTQNEDGTWKHETKNDLTKKATYGTAVSFDTPYFPGFAYDASLTKNGDATVPANNDLVVKLYYVSVPRTYHVEHYLQEIDGSWPSAPVQRDSITGRVGNKAVYTPMSPEGFTYDKSLTENKNALIPDADDLVIRLYYNRRADLSYTVEYRLNHEKGRSIAPAKKVQNAIFGQIITELPVKVPGYVCYEESHDIEITVKAAQNKYIFIYEKVYRYRVEYYYDGVKNDNATEYITLYQNEPVTTYPGKNKAGYKMDHVENLPLEIIHNGKDNIIRVYYEKVEPVTAPALLPQSMGIMHVKVTDCFE